MGAKIVGIEAGLAKVDVTPHTPQYLAGLKLNRLSEGVHDNIYARACLVYSGSRGLALVGVDSIGLMHNHLEQLEEKLLSKGVALLLSSTHSHSCPDVIGLWGPDPFTSGVDDEYLEYLLSGVEEAIEEASEKVTRCTIDVGCTMLPEGVAKNTRDPGFIDREISYLVLRSTDSGKVLGTVANFGLHPEVLWNDNRLVTADFVHYLCHRLEEKLGGTALFLNGALGGMVTPDVTSRTFEEAERVGVTIADAIVQAYGIDGVDVEVSGEVVFARKRLKLPVHNAKLIRASEAGIIKRTFSKPPMVESEVCVAAIKPLVWFATLPGEPLPKVGAKAKSCLKGPYKFLLGLGNDEIGYIIDETDWRDGGYEESMSLGPLTASILLNASSKLAELLS